MESTRKNAKLKGEARYFTGKPCKNGHTVPRRTVNGVCCTCSLSIDKKYRTTNKEHRKLKRVEYAINNPEIVIETRKKSKMKNRVKNKETRVKYVLENKEKIKEQHNRWRERNKDYLRLSRREYYKLYMRERRKDPLFKMKTTMRGMVRRIFNKTKCNKNSRTESLVGYTHVALKKHIEGLFVTGMNWDNYGEWHIDHVVSISSMIKKGVTDPKIINALSNLQPLWAIDNLKKRCVN